MFNTSLLQNPAANKKPLITDWPQRFEQLAQSSRDPRLKKYYAHGAPAGETPISEISLLSLDIETTGLNPKVNGIVSIGIVPMTLECIHASKARHWIVKPREKLIASSVAIHGITHSQIQNAPDLDHILDEVLEAFAGQVMVVHCRDIERSFFYHSLFNRLKEGIEFPVIDTMELEARLHRKKPLSLLARLLGKRPTSIRLADSRTRYGLPRYRAHNALTDALASAELLQAQLIQRFTPQTPLSELWQ